MAPVAAKTTKETLVLRLRGRTASEKTAKKLVRTKETKSFEIVSTIDTSTEEDESDSLGRNTKCVVKLTKYDGGISFQSGVAFHKHTAPRGCIML